MFIYHIRIPPPFPLKQWGNISRLSVPAVHLTCGRSSHSCSHLTHAMISPMHLFLYCFTLISLNPPLNSETIIKELTGQFYPWYPNSVTTSLNRCSYSPDEKLWSSWKTKAAPYHCPNMQIHQVFASQNFSLNSSAHH